MICIHIEMLIINLKLSANLYLFGMYQLILTIYMDRISNKGVHDKIHHLLLVLLGLVLGLLLLVALLVLLSLLLVLLLGVGVDIGPELGDLSGDINELDTGVVINNLLTLVAGEEKEGRKGTLGGVRVLLLLFDGLLG